jgi:hypothetical protein
MMADIWDKSKSSWLSYSVALTGLGDRGAVFPGRCPGLWLCWPFRPKEVVGLP